MPIDDFSIELSERNRKIATELHEKVKNRLAKTDLDLYGYRHNPQNDPLILDCKNRIKDADHFRKHLSGPTAMRQRFTSSYWKKWNTDLQILEDECRQDQIKEQKSMKVSKNTKNSPIKKVKRILPKYGPSAVFVKKNSKPLPYYEANHSENTIDSVSVPFLMTVCLNQKIPQLSPVKFNENDFGHNHIKGGDFTRAQAHTEPSINLTTALCEIKSVERVKLKKDIGMFSIDAKFPKIEKPFDATIARFDQLVANKPKPTALPFSVEERFPDILHQRSPGPQHYNVSFILSVS